MFAVDLFQCTHAYIGDNLRDLRASSGLTECHGVLFRAEQVLVGAMGWWSGPTNALETVGRPGILASFFITCVMQKNGLIWNPLPLS